MINLATVVSQAFDTFKEDADELAQVSIKIRNQKYKLADIIREMLEYLCEEDAIDIRVSNMAHQRRVSSSRLATAATLAMPENRAEATAYYLNQLDEDDIDRMLPFLLDKVRRNLADRLSNASL